MQSIRHTTFGNGLQLVTESIPDVRTTAIEWIVPAGVASNEHDGDSVLLTELMFRGAGDLTDKEHSLLLDHLGVRRDITCGSRLLRLHALSLGSRVTDAIGPVFDMFLCPKLPSDSLGPSIQLALQSIDSLQDNPQKLVGVSLNKHHFPEPFNRSTYGSRSAIESATIERVRYVYDNFVCPSNSILSIAGDLDHNEIKTLVEKQVSCWAGGDILVREGAAPSRGVHHLEHDSSQVHIGLAIDAPNPSDEDSILEKVAISVFGGASSSRLFTEVRQKRSLCYSVHALYQASKENAAMKVRAGTTPDRAKETIDVIIDHLCLLQKGITRDEFERTVTKIRASTVMSGESTVARAGSLLGDMYALGRTRTLKEKLDELTSITLDDVNEYLKKRVFGTMTLVYLGPDPIEIDESRLRNL